jgi:raffinose/stachyose/melibiose transport system permease protein
MRTPIASVSKGIAVMVVSLVSLLPFYSLFYLSVRSPSARSFEGQLLVPDFRFANFVEAWNVSRIGQAIGNSLVITAGAVLVLILFASAAGFAIARNRDWFHRLAFRLFLVCMMIPAIIITVPLYTLMKSINGINTHWAMILLLAAHALPFSVFLYTNFIRAIPREMEEAAVIDGCTPFAAFWRVTFHLLKPVTASVIILNGLSIWNNYAQSVFFLQDQSMRTVPLAVSMFFQKYGAQWNLMAAAAVIGLAPAVAAFLLFQRYFMKGIAAGAVKG